MAVAINFASCQKDADVTSAPKSDREVSFSAESIAPLTRVSGTSWNEGDAISIIAYSINSPATYYDNIKYVANESGLTVSFSPDSETFYYPEDGANIQINAYYPYQENWSYKNLNMICDISTQDGTQEAQKKVDLLKATAQQVNEGDDVVFQFAHAFSKVQITVSNYDELSAFENLNNLTATLHTDCAQFDHANNVTLYGEEKSLGMVKTIDGDNIIFTAIIAPNSYGVNDEIIFTDGSYSYATTLSIRNAEPNKQYNFTTVVGDQGLTLVAPTSDSVTDWNTQTDTSITKIDMLLIDNIYYIYTAKGFKEFADKVNDGELSINAKLMADITLSGNWYPMITDGDEDNGYSGTFDGYGHSITGLNVSDYYAPGLGLFGTCSGATIKNLKVGGKVKSLRSHNAIIVGQAWNTTIENCETLEGSTVIYWNDDTDCFAGILGYARGATIRNCINRATINGRKYVGGIVGYCSPYGSATTITNCWNSGTIDSTSDFTGGIVGKIFGSENCESFILNCANSGSISCTGSYAGGLVGANQGGSIHNSYNRGGVSGGDIIGGLVGIHEDHIKDDNTTYAHMSNCYTSTTDVKGDANIGLAIGENDSSYISNSYCPSSDSTTPTIGSNNNSEDVEKYKEVDILLTDLKDYAPNITGAASWTVGDDGLPTFSFITE